MENQNRIREVRKSLKLSGPEVAAKVGISTTYLYDIEKGRRGLNAEIASKLSDIFEATTDYLLCKTDVNLYSQNTKNNPEPHEESELSEIPIEKLNQYKLVYKGHELSADEAEDIIQLLEAALKRWKK
ncbi:helix-turn-helix domain-containing protein [Shouchella clausii]|uniref:helix-turn-helix domain-containing protein n=1 Tax=Shouchella clausii TaxID=79880 RepID=UPI0028A2168B|nr:helix-turn-helix transcriptional regulator [Shouchella clausii]